MDPIPTPPGASGEQPEERRDGQPGTPMHPLLACLEAVERALDGVRGVDPTDLSPTDKAQALLRLHRVGERIHAAKLAVLAAATDVAETDASRSPGAWLDKHTSCGHREAAREERLARALATRWTATGQARTPVGSLRGPRRWVKR